MFSKLFYFEVKIEKLNYINFNMFMTKIKSFFSFYKKGLLNENSWENKLNETD
jgi:hypothetical protein